jgi:putative aldouronate transport system substrate-binding protein
MKRILSIGAALAAGALLAGALSADDRSIPASVIPKDTVTLQVFSQVANYSGLQTGWFGDLMLKKFNVKLNIISDPKSSGIYETRMESGNLGDLVVWGSDGEKYAKACDTGKLLDWEEEGILGDYGPYIKANMPYALEKNRKISGGKLYGFGHSVSASAKDRERFFLTWDLRYDLYEKLGKPRVRDLDDMVKTLADMKKANPRDDNGKPTYGVSLFNDWDGKMAFFIQLTATAYYGVDNVDFGLYNPETREYHEVLEKDGPYLRILKFYNELNQLGLVDPDSQAQKYNGMLEKYQNGSAFLNIFNWMGSGTYNTDAHLKAGKGMFPVAPEDAALASHGLNVYGFDRIWSIGAGTKYPELCMAILNWLSTPEGFLTRLYGPKGVTWDYDKSGKTYFTPLGKLTSADPNQPMAAPYSGTFRDGSFQINNETWAMDTINPDSKEPYGKDGWASNKTGPKSEVESRWRAWAKADTPDEYIARHKLVFTPGTMYSEDPIPDRLKVQYNQIAESIKNNSWRAIYAKSDKEFDQIVAEMDKEVRSYGYADMLAFTKTQLAREDAAIKAVKVK